MATLTGAEFNAKNTRKLCKLTNKVCCHNGFQFKEELNVDTVPFRTDIDCCPGGIYITFMDCFGDWTYYRTFMGGVMDMVYIWDVEIPDEAKVYVEDPTKIKVDKLVLSNQRPIDQLLEWQDPLFQLRAVNKIGGYHNIRYVIAPSRALQENALEWEPMLINLIKDPMPDLVQKYKEWINPF